MNEYFDINLNIKDYPIGGKLIVASYKTSDLEALKNFSDNIWREKVRQHLITKITQCILENKLCEITTKNDPITYEKIIYARAYLAPDDQIRILRSLK